MMKNDPPTAEQKAWREKVREYGSVITPRHKHGIVIHHPIGRTACVKIDYVTTNIGHWWILPLLETEHATMHGLPGRDRKAREKALFMELICHIVMTEGWKKGVPFQPPIYEAIMKWTR